MKPKTIRFDAGIFADNHTEMQTIVDAFESNPETVNVANIGTLHGACGEDFDVCDITIQVGNQKYRCGNCALNLEGRDRSEALESVINYFRDQIDME